VGSRIAAKEVDYWVLFGVVAKKENNFKDRNTSDR